MRHEETSSSSDENYDNDDVEAMPRDFDVERLIDAFLRQADRE